MNSQETTRSLTRLVRQSRIPTLCWSAGFNISVSTYHGRQDVEITSGARWQHCTWNQTATTHVNSSAQILLQNERNFTLRSALTN